MFPYGSHTWAKTTTTNAFAALGTKTQQTWDKAGLKTTTIVIRNTGANAATIQVVGSVDEGKTFDVGLLAAEALNAGATKVLTFTTYVSKVQVQAKANVADSQTDVEAYGEATAY